MKKIMLFLFIVFTLSSCYSNLPISTAGYSTRSQYKNINRFSSQKRHTKHISHRRYAYICSPTVKRDTRRMLLANFR